MEISKLEWYQNECGRTYPDLGSEKINLAHLALGVGSETSEVIDAVRARDTVNMGEEIADQMWYIGNYSTARDYKLQELWELIDNLEVHEGDEVPLYNISKLQDLVKKFIAYNKEIDRVAETDTLVRILYGIRFFCEYYNIDIESILESNIQKLRIRYPEKFTEELALNRDLVSERKALEANETI